MIKIAKTQLTTDLEKALWRETSNQGVFNCFEVTIGWWGKERVDMLQVDTKGIWRCYEIKVSKSDFHSKAKKTFVGHYNYFVMTEELYQEVKDEIAENYKGIGVYAGYNSGGNTYVSLVKRPKKQELQVEEDVLKSSMIRSLYREVEKAYKSNKIEYLADLERRNNRLEKDLKDSNKDFRDYQRAIYAELGREKYHEFQDKYRL